LRGDLTGIQQGANSATLTRDNAGRITRISNNGIFYDMQDSETKNFEYDKLGRKTNDNGFMFSYSGLKLNDNTYGKYAYDALGRITEIQDLQNNNIINLSSVLKICSSQFIRCEKQCFLVPYREIFSSNWLIFATYELVLTTNIGKNC